MSVLSKVEFINEAGGATIQYVPGLEVVPRIGEFVWLGEIGQALSEWKVEKVSYYFTPRESGTLAGGTTTKYTDSEVKVTVSVV